MLYGVGDKVKLSDYYIKVFDNWIKDCFMDGPNNFDGTIVEIICDKYDPIYSVEYYNFSRKKMESGLFFNKEIIPYENKPFTEEDIL